VKTTHRCPDNARHADDVVGCGKSFEVEPDAEGFVDCPHCGMFFKIECTCAAKDMPFLRCCKATSKGSSGGGTDVENSHG